LKHKENHRWILSAQQHHVARPVFSSTFNIRLRGIFLAIQSAALSSFTLKLNIVSRLSLLLAQEK
jgi:hypothetical protein